MKPQPKPLALLILVVVMLIFVYQLSYVGSWSPPYLGRDLGWSRPEPAQATLWLDPMGLEDFPKLPFLPDLSSLIEPDRLVQVTPQGSEFVSVGRDRVAPFPQGGFPRLKIMQGSGGHQVSASLFQPHIGRNLFRGPVTGRMGGSLYRPEGPGLTLDTLKLLPRSTERLLLLDTGGFAITKELKEDMITQWKRWEFEPYVSLNNTFGPAFCYAEWGGHSFVIADLLSRERFEKALRRRFPLTVLELVSTWSHGTTISGFEATSKPAWTVRGDQLISTTDGGLEALDTLLLERYGQDHSYRRDSPLLQELLRLSETEKGWHVCVLEQRPQSQIHWAALLRWPEAGTDEVEGYAVIWLPAERKRE